MIASVRGSVQAVGLDFAVVDVGGVGLHVFTTPGTAAGLRRGDAAALATSLVVREESLTLYGFAEADERDLFELVQTVSGVGPRLALAMLAVHPPDQLRAAISSGNLVALVKVPGIGRKGAERIVLELRDKVVVASGSTARPAGGTEVAPWRQQVGQALVGLGWSTKQADDALDAVATDATDTADVSALLKAALRELGR